MPSIIITKNNKTKECNEKKDIHKNQSFGSSYSNNNGIQRKHHAQCASEDYTVTFWYSKTKFHYPGQFAKRNKNTVIDMAGIKPRSAVFLSLHRSFFFLSALQSTLTKAYLLKIPNVSEVHHRLGHTVFYNSLL
jgi:hypothetical protein